MTRAFKVKHKTWGALIQHIPFSVLFSVFFSFSDALLYAVWVCGYVRS